MARQADSELTLPCHETESILTRYEKISEYVRKLSKMKFNNEERVKLVVVTKRQPLDACLELIAAGATNLGENYPEESVEKFAGVDLGSIDLHMIGHVQSRKIKILHSLFQYIHSIDSMDLAKKINNYYAQQELKVNVLIEVDFTSEITKSGFRVSDRIECINFLNTFNDFLKLEALNIIGLMTMGHYPDNEETNKYVFKACKTLLNSINERYELDTLCELSMGTSGDYKTAINEGATMVRIGELIMGPRAHS